MYMTMLLLLVLMMLNTMLMAVLPMLTVVMITVVHIARLFCHTLRCIKHNDLIRGCRCSHHAGTTVVEVAATAQLVAVAVVVEIVMGLL